jgi:coproporphyrinogen III oxidase
MRGRPAPVTLGWMTSGTREEIVRIHLEFAAATAALQQDLCAALERADGGAARFGSDAWERPGGGGGLARVLEEGAVLEKAGVNFSDVRGEVPAPLAARLPGDGPEFVATGLSVVVHPRSPMVPTAHANVRFLARGAAAWFGGGADLTPYYLFEEDCAEFHRALRELCERHLPGRHGELKRAADAYFFLPHRGEHRGVGGIFFDDLGGDLGSALAFARELPRVFLAAYLAIVARRREAPWGEEERRWQEIRRGRYVEFNLVHDRGTLFGLETRGRIESVLMSLPPRVRWPYDHRPADGSREDALLEVLRRPRDWA